MNRMSKWFYLNHMPLLCWALLILGALLIVFDIGLLAGVFLNLIVQG